MKAIHSVLLVVIATIRGSAAEGFTDVCRDKDMNCPTWKKLGRCDNPNRVVEYFCGETCQLCQPPEEEECYFTSGEKSKYGCCWDGRTPASGPDNEGCPVCENSKPSIFCRHFKGMCVDSKSTQELRDDCPETCGYCKKAPSPCYDESGHEITCEDQCFDIAPEELCKKRKQAGFCSNENWQDFLKTNCAKTCYFCGERPFPTPASQLKLIEPACSDYYGERLCEMHKWEGRCTKENWKTFMKKNCAKTCDLCDDDGKNAEDKTSTYI